MKETSNQSRWVRCFLAAILILAMSTGAFAAQKNKKKDKDQSDASQSSSGLSFTPAQQIDQVIGEMLAAFQLGDVEMMHKYYADNATFVSGDYSPLIVGWQNYAPLYQRQMVGFEGVQLIRRNTFIFAPTNVAWVSYQWEFLSNYKGQPFSTRGQTTLIFNKVGDKWLIVHNHTSESSAPPPQAAPQTSGQNPVPTAPRNP